MSSFMKSYVKEKRPLYSVSGGQDIVSGVATHHFKEGFKILNMKGYAYRSIRSNEIEFLKGMVAEPHVYTEQTRFELTPKAERCVLA